MGKNKKQWFVIHYQAITTLNEDEFDLNERVVRVKAKSEIKARKKFNEMFNEIINYNTECEIISIYKEE